MQSTYNAFMKMEGVFSIFIRKQWQLLFNMIIVVHQKMWKRTFEKFALRFRTNKSGSYISKISKNVMKKYHQISHSKLFAFSMKRENKCCTSKDRIFSYKNNTRIENASFTASCLFGWRINVYYLITQMCKICETDIRNTQYVYI